MMMLVIAMLGLQSIKAQLNISHTSGFAHFRSRGELVDRSGSAILLISVDTERLHQEANNLKAALARRSRDTTMAGWQYLDFIKKLTQLQKHLRADMVFFAKHADRHTRDLASFLGGIFGLFNTVQIQQLSAKEDSSRQGLHTVVHQVDAINSMVNDNQKSIFSITTELNREKDQLWLTGETTRLHDDWHHIQRPFSALQEIAAGLLQQQCHSALGNIVNLPKIWEDFRQTTEKKGHRLAVEEHQHLFHLPASYMATETVLTIAVQVPMIREESHRYKLWELSEAVLNGQQPLQVARGQQWLAINTLTGTKTLIDAATVKTCSEVGATHYCDIALVIHTSHTSSCVTTLWKEEWLKVQDVCELWAFPTTAAAWTTTAGTFVTFVNETTELILMCPKETPRRYWLTGMQHVIFTKTACTASTNFFDLQPAYGEKEEEQFIMSISAGNLTTVESATREQHMELKRPTPLHAIEATVEQQLQAGDSKINPLILTALILAGAAAVGMVGFIAYLYIQARIAWRLPVRPNDGRREEEAS